MSAPLSRPNSRCSVGLWLRNEPGWICITSPSSRLIRAISVSIWARNSSASCGSEWPADDLLEQRHRRHRVEVGRRRGRVAVVGRGRAHLLEIGPALLQGGEIAAPGMRVLAGDLAQRLQPVAEAVELRIDHRVGPEGGDHPALPAAVADGAVVVERVERRFRGGDDLEVETLEQRPRPELRPGQRGRRCGRRSGRRWPASAAPPPRTGSRRCGRATSGSGCRGTDANARRSGARSPADRSRPGRRRAAARRDPPASRPGCRACGRRSGRG